MSKVILTIPEITCGHCAMTVTNALKPNPGVKTVRVDIPKHEVLLDFEEDEISLDTVKELLAREEYPVEDVRLAS